MSYCKEDVKLHNDGGTGGPYYPAVNVKVYGGFPSEDEIAARFGCSLETARKAGEWAYDSHQEQFWRDAEDDAINCFGNGVKVYSAGRMGGWAIVEGLPPVEAWDAVLLAKWRRFEKWLHENIDYLCSKAAVYETIEANEWAIDDAAINQLLAVAAS